MAPKRKKASKKRKVNASRVRLRDLDARKGKVSGGQTGQMGFGGFGGVLKKPGS
ncbi:MAG TPA: hypothetical protein VKJ00_13030 [Thermoanaerobaculia bacterium]|nr:hypothetical protein [Thermoanaerobaculia bacterium]